MLEEGQEAMTTRLMLALRTREGISYAELAEHWGSELGGAAVAACKAAAEELPSEWVAVAASASASGEEPQASGEAAQASSGAEQEPREEAEARDEGGFALADPEGLLFSNEAIATVFARLDEQL